MTSLASALLVAAIAVAPATRDGEGRRPRHEAPRDRARARAAAVAGRAAPAPDPRGREIEVTVLGAADGVTGGPRVLELGAVSSVTVLKRVVTVRIGSDATGFAPLRAHLQAGDGRCRIHVDGKPLTAVPQMIDALAPLGRPVPHLVEIEIPDTASEGPISASIAWTSDEP